MENTIKIKGRKTVIKTVETPKDVLTLEILQDKVLEGIQRCHDNGNEDIRNFEEILHLLNFLFDYSIKQMQAIGNNEKETESRIAGDLKASDLLLGYTHYLSGSDTNPYNWSYLLDCRNRFANFLCRFTSYIVWVAKDMNALLSSFDDKKEMTFVIDGYLGLHKKVEEENKVLEAHILFDELYRIYSISANGYRLKVLYEDKVIGVFWRNRNSNLDDVINFIKEELCHYKNI